ncbi:YslB family protein [Sporosarcina sp. HYO08]|uniref:YslB family protein n=1 Tax=Sporosarcina sp. HYO08 TaxID=1759557 RepID=UPI00079321B4|nr:YslB family protein [Sporosarcina sp. HYO08]KXH87269.1 hypothetical protein AU377_01465 [Sporosarcina sp. HYO08]
MENLSTTKPTHFGYEILKDHVLPSILGKHEEEILYWAGKDVARKFPVFSTDELPEFFKEAGWGELILEKTVKDSAFYILKNISGQSTAQNRVFTLEAGFLAEQYQKLNGVLTECYGEKNENNDTVQFQVKWDKKTTV